MKKQKIIFIIKGLLFLFLSFSLANNFLIKPELQNIKNFVSERISALAFDFEKFDFERFKESFFTPNFPTRLRHIVEETSEISNKLISLNEALLESTRQCDCSLAQSLCMPKILYGQKPECKPLFKKASIFGKVCPEQETIDQVKIETTILSEIRKLSMQISYLDKLLEKEKETGLEKQLQTLREDDAKLLKDNLEKIKILKTIADIAKKNVELPDECSTAKCNANCGLGQGFGAEACVEGWSGEQKPIQLNVKFGVSMTDLDLGNVTIKNVNLNLPDKLKINMLPKLSGFSIELPRVPIACPNQKKTIKVQSPNIQMPEFPLIEFCPKQGSNRSSSYNFDSKKQENVKDIDRLWYSEINNWLSDKCFSKLEWMSDYQNCTKSAGDFCDKSVCNCDTCDENCNTVFEICKKSCSPSVISITPPDFEKISRCIKNCETSKENCEKGCDKAMEAHEKCIDNCENNILEQESEQKKEKCKNNCFLVGDSCTNCIEKCSEDKRKTDCDPIIERAKKCYKNKEMVQLISSRCQELWERRCKKEKLSSLIGLKQDLPEVPEICKLIRYSCSKNNNKIPSALQCKNLFNLEKLSVPAECQYKIKGFSDLDKYSAHKCDYNEEYEGNFPINYFCFPKNFNPIETIKQKCEEIKKQKREDIPEQCKNLPLYTGVLEEPTGAQEYELDVLNHPSSDTITDYPNTSIIKNCPKDIKVSVPKITFPKIEFPDIITPDFNFKPFIEVNVPDIIIEDLQIPDVELCNLDDCQFKFPYLSFKMPSLHIPSIGLPPITIPRYPNISIEMEEINFPDIKFEFPDLINLFSFVEPDLDFKLIKELPKPKFHYSIGGIKGINVVDLLLGLFKIPWKKIPNLPSGCASFGLKGIPLRLNFPDFHWEWWEIPKIPEIPYCKNVREFCKNANSFIKQITERADEIQDNVDKTFGEEVQEGLDKVAEEINKNIKKKIEEEYNQIAKKIADEIDRNLDKYLPENTKEIIERSKEGNQGVPIPGVWQLGEVSLPCEKISPIIVPPLEVSEISFSDIDLKDEISALRKKTSDPKLKKILDWLLTTEIPITWPDRLKKINLLATDKCLKICDKVHNKIQKLCKNDQSCLDISQNEGNYNECKQFCNERKGLTYSIGKIPFSKINFSKEIPIDLPGFQLKKPKFGLKLGGGAKACVSNPPGGGNPCPIAEIQRNLEKLKELNKDIQLSSKQIIEMLR